MTNAEFFSEYLRMVEKTHDSTAKLRDFPLAPEERERVEEILKGMKEAGAGLALLKNSSVLLFGIEI